VSRFHLALLATLLLTSTSVTLYGAGQLRQRADALALTQERLTALGDLSSSVVDAERSQHAYLLTGAARHIGARGMAAAAISQKLEHVRELLEDEPSQQDGLARLRQLLTLQLNSLTQLPVSKPGAALDMSRQTALTDQWLQAANQTQRLLTEMTDAEASQARAHARLVTRAYVTTVAGSIITALLGFVTLARLLHLRRQHASERGRMLAEVHAQHELLEATLQRMSDAVLVVDPEGTVTFLNAPAASLTGWSAADALGRHVNAVLRVLDRHSRQPIDNAALQALRWGRLVEPSGATLLMTRDGQETLIHESAAPLRHADGKVRAALLVIARQAAPTDAIRRAD
jgi:PAS domain S-box-containing protein